MQCPRVAARTSALLLTLVLAPGAVAEQQAANPWAELESQIRARGLDPEEVEIPGRLTDEIRDWANRKVPGGVSEGQVLRRLLWALIDPFGLNLTYDPGRTGTASEVWASGKANCLGFTHLFVGLSRELGIPTYYVRWSRIENYRKEGDLIVVSEHVSAGFGAGAERQVLEFGAVDGLGESPSHPISDLEALARHYANRSAEWLQEGNLSEARTSAEIAVQLEPELPEGWVNLGVARRRSGDLEGAKEAYTRATVVDVDHLPAYQNLSVLMEIQGEKDVAREILALLDRRDNRNPFIYLSLGDFSLDTGQLDEAERFYRRASKLGPELAATRAARGLLALEAGDLKAARKWLKRSQSIDPEDHRALRLAGRLSRMGDSTE